MQKLMGDEVWGGGGGACFSLLTPSVCASKQRVVLTENTVSSFARAYGNILSVYGVITVFK